ncbi:MAG: ABC transporter ATP-binding protein [Desulfatiglans sp.]|nr:ABC transporter ATP-binding protein [Desulfatiglans sp.]
MNHDIVTVKDLEKRFGSFTAVKNITFSVKKGEIFGFLGPNGAGKSTTIRMLCGILTPTSGEGSVAGYDIIRNPEGIKHSIGYMSQKFSLYEDMTPFENIRFYLGVYSVPQAIWQERTEWVLEMADLKELRNRLTRDLPQGWRQRLALGCALIHRPEIIFLDEPTSGVDPVTRRHFWAFIKGLSEKGMTIFVTTHYMNEALNCGRIVMINNGTIVVSGAPLEVIKNVCPEKKDADLNDVFIRLMKRE